MYLAQELYRSYMSREIPLKFPVALIGMPGEEANEIHVR